MTDINRIQRSICNIYWNNFLRWPSLGQSKLAKPHWPNKWHPNESISIYSGQKIINSLLMTPLFFLANHPRKLIIDEAQLMPSLFSILKSVIDQHRQEKGRFILTRSVALIC